jgi:hypothetical protein
METPRNSISWRRWIAGDINELEAAERTLQRFVDLATARDDSAAWKLVYPPSRALWAAAPSEVLAAFRSELEVVPGSGLEFGLVATARIIHREAEGEPDVVAFGFTALAGNGVTLMDGPRQAKTMGLIYEEGWWVWGAPTSEAFATAELVPLPVATHGSQVLASHVALEWMRALEPHLGAIMGRLPADQRVTQRERAQAMACIALLSFAIEAAGAKLVVKGVVHAGESIEAVAETLGNDDRRSELDELIVLRNSVVHGHIWRITHEWGPGAADSTAEDRAYGRDDPRYRRVCPWDRGRRGDLGSTLSRVS